MNLIKPDSAGLIYPYVKTKTHNAVFRMEADLTEAVDFAALKKAVADISRRFPSLFVNLVEHNNMYMLSPASDCDIVCEEPDNVCTPFDFERQVPMRVAVFGNRIAVETFHMLADGHGALIFIETLLAHYFNLMGADIEYTGDIFNPFDAPTEQEITDNFIEISREKRKVLTRAEPFAYQYRHCDKIGSVTLSVLRTPIGELNALAKRYNTTIGIFLTSVYMYSFYLLQQKKSKSKIRISIPVDLRSFFPTESIRNFSLYAIVSIKPREREWTLPEIIETVTAQAKKTITKQTLANIAYTNVKSSNTWFFKHLPMPLKKLALNFGYDYLGERLFTSTLSNMGNIAFPEKLRERIIDFRPFLGQSKLHRVNVVTSAYADFVNIIFSSGIENDDIQKTYMSILKENGLDIERYDRYPDSKDYAR